MANTIENTIEKEAGPNMALALASRFIATIKESGAAQTEVIAALGVVQCLLPTIGISVLTEEEERGGAEL